MAESIEDTLQLMKKAEDARLKAIDMILERKKSTIEAFDKQLEQLGYKGESPARKPRGPNKPKDPDAPKGKPGRKPQGAVAGSIAPKAGDAPGSVAR